MNQINTILPYRSMGGWAFDDAAVGLEREPFVAGADKAIDKIVKHLGIETDKIKMTFSKDKFPGHHVKLLYLAPDTIAVWDGGGDFYRIEDDNFNIDLWLCPALLKYFDIAPDEIYVKVEEYN